MAVKEGDADGSWQRLVLRPIRRHRIRTIAVARDGDGRHRTIPLMVVAVPPRVSFHQIRWGNVILVRLHAPIYRIDQHRRQGWLSHLGFNGEIARSGITLQMPTQTSFKTSKVAT